MDKMRLIDKIKAYKLGTRVILFIIVIILFAISLRVYFVPEIHNNKVYANIMLAAFTSLLVTILTSGIDILATYNKHKNDIFLENMYQFGIGTLNIHKKEMLQKMLKSCKKKIWISGYRLILTKDIKSDIADAIRRGAKVTVLICPPWSKAFKLVYGNMDKVLDNYLQFFNAIYNARDDCGKSGKKYDKYYKIYFINKPLFSDTYRIDENIITGPYMHNDDPDYHKMMAKDFFSYCISKDSKLFKMVEDEFETLRHKARIKLDWTQFKGLFSIIEKSDYNEEKKSELLKKTCITVERN